MLIGILLMVSGLVFPAAAHFWMTHYARFVTAGEVLTHDSIQHVASVIAAVVGLELCVGAWCRRPVQGRAARKA